MLQDIPFPIRTECPPGACVCERDALLNNPDGDARILRLTRDEEKKLLARIESIDNYADLLRIQDKLHAQLGVTLSIAPSLREVKSARGVNVQVADLPGMCRKTRQAIPSAVRRCLDQHPDIVMAILNANDLLGDS